MITKISSLEKALETKRATYKSEFTIYEAQILELKRKLENYKTLISSGNLTTEDINNLNNLMEEERQVDSDFAAQQILYKEQTDDTRKKIEEVEKAIKDINVKVTAATDYIAKRAELTFGNLAMGKVEFKLCKVLKTTGEVKDCFELTYDKRDYKRLSRSESILAGVSVSEFIKQITDRNYPMFIDDTESVSNIPRPTGQSILARVVPNSPLKVSGLKMPTDISRAA